MSMSQDRFLETALSLPPSERANLAFQLLQSLEQPGEEIAEAAFGAELCSRLEAYHRGELDGFSRDQTRAIIQQRISEEFQK